MKERSKEVYTMKGARFGKMNSTKDGLMITILTANGFSNYLRDIISRLTCIIISPNQLDPCQLDLS